MHENGFCMFLYHDTVSSIYKNTNGLTCFALTFLNMLAVFTVAVVIDKLIREPLQKPLQKLALATYFNLKNKVKSIIQLQD